jgi:molybdopterin/thiamine biosynthesis adenylyltransferase
VKTGSIRLLNDLYKKIYQETINSADESVAFLTAKYFETSNKVIFIAEDIIPAKPQDYLDRSDIHLKVSPIYTSRVLNIAEDKDNSVIMVHSHPFEKGNPKYSVSDDYGEALTSETISKNLIDNPPVGSLLVGQKEVNARAWTGLTKKHFTSTVTILNGEKYWMHHFDSKGRHDNIFVDRQIRALGTHTQGTIESLDIGIVGLGGTGSIIAEQLARIGVKHLTIVDHDEFELSNWSRLYGSTWKDTKGKKSKVSIVSSHLKKISSQVNVTSIKASVMTKKVLASLSGCDIIFSCLDRHAPRAVLNELSYQCFIPVIDVGVGLIKDDTGVLGGAIRATIIGPGLPCLFCQEIVRPEMITSELLSPQEYERRRAEGYASNAQDKEPSVIAYTSLAGSFGMMLFFDLIAGHDLRNYSTVLYDLRTKESLRLRANIKDECVCKNRLGKGLSVPFSVAD